MRIKSGVGVVFILAMLLSCKTRKDKEPVVTAKESSSEEYIEYDVDSIMMNQKPLRVEDGTAYFNEMQIGSSVKLKRAFLMFDDGMKVPADNRIDFKRSVILVLRADSGWVSKEDKVYLDGDIQIYDDASKTKVLDATMDALFGAGISETDAKAIRLTINFPEVTPQSLSVTFGIKDKNGSGYISGAFRLYNSKN